MALVDTASETFDDANGAEVCRRVFEQIGTDCLELRVTDGDAVHVVFEDGAASVEAGAAPVDLSAHTISGSERAFRNLFEGRVGIVDAAWNGQIRAEVYHGRPDLYFALQQAIKAHVPTLEPEPF